MKVFGKGQLIVLTLGAVMVPTIASAQGGGLLFFSSQGAFRSEALNRGKTMKGMEDFEEGRLNAGQGFAMDDPLNAATNNAFYFPGEIEDNLQIQSNLGGANSGALSPRGASGLAVFNTFGGNPDKWVVANFFVDSLDIMFTTPKTAVGGNPLNFSGAGVGRIDVYGVGNVFLGSAAGVNFSPNTFWGVVSNTPIERINLFGDGLAEGMDDIEMWQAVPEPATFVALGLGAAALLRRRAKK